MHMNAPAFDIVKGLHLLLFVTWFSSVTRPMTHTDAACQSVEFRFKLAVQVLPDVVCAQICSEYAKVLQSQLAPTLKRSSDYHEKCFMQNKKCFGDPISTAISGKTAADLVQAGYPEAEIERFPRWQPRLPGEDDIFCGCDAAMLVFRVRKPSRSGYENCEQNEICTRFQGALLPIKNSKANQLTHWQCAGSEVRDQYVSCYTDYKRRPEYLIWCTNCNPPCRTWQGRHDQKRPKSVQNKCVNLNPFDPSTYQTVSDNMRAAKAEKFKKKAAEEAEIKAVAQATAAANREELKRHRQAEKQKLLRMVDLAAIVPVDPQEQRRLPHDFRLPHPGDNPLPRVIFNFDWPFNQYLSTTSLKSAFSARPGPAAIPHTHPRPWLAPYEASTSDPADTRGRLPLTGRPHQPYTPEIFNFGQAAGSQPLRGLQLLDELMADTTGDERSQEPTGIVMMETNDAGVSLELTLAQPPIEQAVEPDVDGSVLNTESGVSETRDGQCDPWPWGGIR